jgi:hypothetical protein
VFLQIFNEICCRKCYNEINFFEGFFDKIFFFFIFLKGAFKNWLFVMVMIITIVLQIVLVQVPGIQFVFSTTSLSLFQWLLCVGIGFLTIPISFISRLVYPLPFETSEPTQVELNDQNVITVQEGDDINKKIPSETNRIFHLNQNSSTETPNAIHVDAQTSTPLGTLSSNELKELTSVQSASVNRTNSNSHISNLSATRIEFTPGAIAKTSSSAVYAPLNKQSSYQGSGLVKQSSLLNIGTSLRQPLIKKKKKKKTQQQPFLKPQGSYNVLSRKPLNAQEVYNLEAQLSALTGNAQMSTIVLDDLIPPSKEIQQNKKSVVDEALLSDENEDFD